MNGKLWFGIVCGLIVIGQLAVPTWMIAQHEILLKTGTAYKFRCEPVDPYDAFRGRYVVLSLLPTEVQFQLSNPSQSEEIYVSLGTDAEGFASFTHASTLPPANGDYLRVRGIYNIDGKVRIQLPFDRYYLDEFNAPAAELAYRQNSLRGASGAHVVVRVKNGKGAIEELYLANQPIGDFLKNPGNSDEPRPVAESTEIDSSATPVEQPPSGEL